MYWIHMEGGVGGLSQVSSAHPMLNLPMGFQGPRLQDYIVLGEADSYV